MTRFDDLDRAVDALLATEAGAIAVPDGLLADTLAITGARRPRPGWLARLTALDVHGWDGGRPVSRAMTLGFAPIALLATALAIGVAGGAFRGDRPLITSVPVPEPSPAASPAASQGSASYPVLPGEPWIVHMSNTAGGGTDRLFLMRPDGTDRQPIFTGLTGEQEHPDWSPDGSLIAFDRHYRDASRPGLDLADVWIVGPDGAGLRLVASCEAPCYQLSYPSFSPDGRTLVVSRFDELSGGIWGPSAVEVIDVASGDRRLVYETPDGSTTMHYPRWSPDGTRILFTYETYSDAAETSLVSTVLAAVDADGTSTEPVILSPDGMEVDSADWHPDGERILIGTRFDPDAIRPGATGTDLFSMRIDGTELANLTSFGAGDQRAIQGTWTPDGTGIVFTLVEGYGDRALPLIATIAADGSDLVVLEPDLGTGFPPTLGLGDGTGGRLRPVPDSSASSP